MKQNRNPPPQYSRTGKTSEEIVAEARETERLQRLAEILKAPRIPEYTDTPALDYLYALEQNIYEMGINEDTDTEMYAEDSINFRVDNDEGTDYNREMAFVQLGLSGGYFLDLKTGGSAYGVNTPMKDFRNINDAIVFTLFAFSTSALRRFGTATTGTELYGMVG